MGEHKLNKLPIEFRISKIGFDFKPKWLKINRKNAFLHKLATVVYIYVNVPIKTTQYDPLTSQYLYLTTYTWSIRTILLKFTVLT